MYSFIVPPATHDHHHHIIITTIIISRNNNNNNTALHIAASEGHLELCQYLIESGGAQVNRSDRWGGSPLNDALRHRHAAVVEYLKRAGGRSGSPSQSTCFITAAAEGDLEEVQKLLEFGNVSVNQGDYDKRTALHLAYVVSFGVNMFKRE